MRLDRVMIAAPKSGSGKTMITCALLKTLKNMGKKPVSYKCGPDYIDPMYHRTVLGIPSKNLDTFFTDDKTTRYLMTAGRTEDDLAVLEGVMGLYDGLGGIYEQGSSYHLAKVTATPIILVVDAKGMGRSVIALISGFLRYDTEHLIKGVILNRMSKGYYDIIRPLIEDELSLRVIGYFPEQKDMAVSSRHLGLIMPDEMKDIYMRLENLAERVSETVDVNAVIEIAHGAKNIKGKEEINIELSIATSDIAKKNNIVHLAVARDEAFCFYYEDNLRLLEKCGAVLHYFSPIHDKLLPEECDGLLIGGGYPELYEKELINNEDMKTSIKRALKKGMPVVAECGGFMYLHYVGIVDADCSYKGKLVRFGYIEIEEKNCNFLPEGEIIRAHEFHYFDSTDNGSDCIAIKPASGRKYECIIDQNNCWMGFPHLYYPSNPHFAENFVRKAQNYRGIKNAELI